MGWLSGWTWRVKLTIDQGDVSAALVDFPVLLYVSASSGRGPDNVTFVFDELEGDANRKKIAVTTSNGTTECYVEVEKWDHANEKAWLWVKVPAVAHDADTELYLYYDKSHADNDAYVGNPQDAVTHNVWDSGFKFVSHMHDYPDTSHVLDSTVNANNGTKGAAGQPQEVTAAIGNSQLFDGTDEHIALAAISTTSLLTVEAWIFPDPAAIARTNATLLEERITQSDWWFVLVEGKMYFGVWDTEGLLTWADGSGEAAFTANTWYHVAGVADGSNVRAYLYGSPHGTTPTYINIRNESTETYIGKDGTAGRYFTGIIDEVRISTVARSASWIRASYESSADQMLDWGSIEQQTFTGTAAFEVEPVVLAGTGTYWTIAGTAAFEVEPVVLAGTGTAEPPIVHAFAGMEITIESPYGTKLGSGPIVTALNWRNSSPLDGIGSFSFEMPVFGPQASLLAKKRYARCYGLVGGSWVELGKTGIIDNIETMIQPGQDPILRVSGGDLLRELTYRQIGYLELVETEAAYTTPGWVKYQTGTDYGNGDPSGPSRDLPKAFDDDVGTEEGVGLFYNSAWPTQTTYIYIGYPVRVAGIKYDLGGSKNNNDGSSVVQFFNGDAWVGVADFVDGTKVGADTLAQDGNMTFTKPATHEKNTHDGVEAYWLRLSVTIQGGADEVDFVEIDVLAEGPTTEGLADIMAFVASMGWSVDTVNGYATTGQAIYTRFKGENVLEALKILAELTGEHFRLGVGRKVVWIRNDPVDDPTACGYRAVPMYGADVEENPLICLIRSLTRTEGSYEEYNRIFPYGAGAYPDRIDLADATDDVPEGYYCVPASNYVQYNAGVAVLAIEKSKVWPEISLLGVGGVHPALASNQLLAAAMADLKRHKDLGKSYDLVVVGLSGIVNPGETIPVQYWEYVAGTLVLDIDATLIILEPTVEVTQDGLYTVALTVSTTDAWPATMEKTVADWLIEVRRGLAG